MPIHTLYLNQSLCITPDITVTLIEIADGEAYLKVDCPAGVPITPFRLVADAEASQQELAG